MKTHIPEPKEADLVISELMLGVSGVIKKYNNPAVHPPEMTKELVKLYETALAHINTMLNDARIDELMHIGGLKVRAKGNYTIDQRLKQLLKPSTKKKGS